MRRIANSLMIFVVAIACGGSVYATEVRLDTPGASKDLRKMLQSASLVFSAAGTDTATAQDLFAAARAEYGNLIGILYAQGYYGPVINIMIDGQEAASVAPYAAPPRIDTIVIAVNPGAEFRFSQARVTPLAPQTLLPESFAPGQIARSTIIADAARAGINGWRAQGYAKARTAGQKIVADHRANSLAADISLTPGRRLTFGDLRISGQSRVRPERILAIAGLPTGSVFDPDEIERATTRLRRSGAFRSVAMTEAESANADGSLDITAVLTDEKKRRLGFGIEIDSLEGLTVSGYWLHRNLLRGAERLRIDGKISGLGGGTGGEDYTLGVSFARPATFTANTTLLLMTELERLDEPSYFEDRFSFGIGLRRTVNDDLTLGAGITFSRSVVQDPLGNRSFTNLLFPVTGTLDLRDDPLNARAGEYLDATVTPFVGLAGTASGLRLTADGRAYRGFGAQDRVVFAGRVQMGSVFGAGLGSVPPDMLFFSGGGGTVRGQPYQSLGVNLPTGTIGGRGFFGLSAEMRVGVTANIAVVGFADAGLIGDKALPFDGGTWHSGAGLGLRYDTGIGPIRLDVAAPVSGNTGNGVQVYIGIGQAF